MIRVPPQANVEIIRHTLMELPLGIRRILEGVHFVIDTDPLWIGLHTYREIGDGRLYCNTSHAVWKCHQMHLSAHARETTVCLLGGDEANPAVILHELGHALDERLQFDRPGVVAMNDYAASNCWEGFAKAFQAWATPRGPRSVYFPNRDQLMEVDPAAAAFFDKLN